MGMRKSSTTLDERLKLRQALRKLGLFSIAECPRPATDYALPDGVERHTLTLLV